jgi:lipopolysaccharide/colanic/teichoic acid biosynthesis glycosyltransferase
MKFVRKFSKSGKTDSSNRARIPGWKRSLDITLVLVSLPVVLPLALGIAVLIRIFSSGPVLFRQERIGYLGRSFMCFKFRTMVVNAATVVHQEHLNYLMSSNAPMEKIDARGDPRVIPFGALLRMSGLDELPQLINVLWGDMSLVGPRPCLPYEFERYLPWQRERCNTLPGLTGLWQVSGKNRTTFMQMVQLDIAYVRNKNIWKDLGIIGKTIPALIVQMRDSRRQRKTLRRPVPPVAEVPPPADFQPSVPNMAISRIIRTNMDVLIQQKSGQKPKRMEA